MTKATNPLLALSSSSSTTSSVSCVAVVSSSLSLLLRYSVVETVWAFVTALSSFTGSSSIMGFSYFIEVPSFAENSFGQPQWGQKSALSLIMRPHSLHFISAISYFLSTNLRKMWLLPSEKNTTLPLKEMKLGVSSNIPDPSLPFNATQNNPFCGS